MDNGSLYFLLEITIKIVSYLNQDECLTAMTVCREWYQNVPRYSKKVWEKVIMTKYDDIRPNRRKELCLGEHVKIAIFDKFVTGSNILSLMEKLIKLDCSQIESMGKYENNNNNSSNNNIIFS